MRVRLSMCELLGMFQGLFQQISYVSMQSCEFNSCAKLEYRIKYLRIKHRFIKSVEKWKFLSESLNYSLILS